MLNKTRYIIYSDRIYVIRLNNKEIEVLGAKLIKLITEGEAVEEIKN